MGLSHPRAPPILLRGVFQLVRPSKLTPVNFCPTLVQTAVGFFLELHFTVVGLPRGDLDVNVRVVRVAVERGDGASLREVLREMLAHHLLRLLVAHFLIERIDRAIMRPSFAVAPAWLRQLILFQLAHVFTQIGGALFVARRILALAINIFRDVASPDALFLLLRSFLACDVADVRAGASAAPDAHLEHHAHRLNSPAISPITRSTCCMA
jgi:hypothetical protein